MKKFVFVGIFVLTLAPLSLFAAADKPTAKTGDSKSFLENVSFDKGTFLGNVNDGVVKFIGQIEAWREEHKISFKESLDNVEKKRELDKDPKPAVKVLTIIHICGLAILLFIFSIQIAFYIALFGIVFWIIKKIIRFILRLFKRHPENA